MTRNFFITFVCLALVSLNLAANSDITIKSNKPIETPRTEAMGKKPGKAPEAELTVEETNRVKELTENFEREVSSIRPLIQEKTKLLKKELNSNTPDLEMMKGLNNELFQLKEKEQLKKIEYQFALSRFLSAQKRKDLNKAKYSKKPDKNNHQKP
jgi:Spy/CpxP family protein refolding chaperone